MKSTRRIWMRSSLVVGAMLIVLGMWASRRLAQAQADKVLATNAANTTKSESKSQPVDFNRDIRPILSNHCYTCHGPDKEQRATDLRLDTKEGALAALEAGGHALVPGKLDQSELWARVVHKDTDLKMPPEDGKPLSAKQIDLLKRWITQGAPWDSHWSYSSPKRPDLPAVKNNAWPRNGIDRFILARLESEGLSPSERADRERLIRRVTLDLTGLPPTLQEIDTFLADPRPDAYDHLVDRLLASPNYGEHQARYWLDAARYGDTHGLHLDNERSMWPYRDWVIRAFNQNMPFDQFTIEQLAGDLLPNPTRDQKLATGFNRCNVSTSEGGSIAEEYRVRYAVDRVETTATVWMGMTAGCAVCHDHKYDPLTQKEFFQFFAFFANTADAPMDDNQLLPPPSMQLPSPDQTARLRQLRHQASQARESLAQALQKYPAFDPKAAEAEAKAIADRPRRDFVWVEDAIPAGAKVAVQNGSPGFGFAPASDSQPVFSGEASHGKAVTGNGQHYFNNPTKPLILGPGDVLYTYVYLEAQNPPKQIMLQFHAPNGGWEHRAFWGGDLIKYGKPNSTGRARLGNLPPAGQWVRLNVPIAKVGLKPGDTIDGWAFTQFDGQVFWDQSGLWTKTDQDHTRTTSYNLWLANMLKTKGRGLPKPLSTIFRQPKKKWNKDQTFQVRSHFFGKVHAQHRQQVGPLLASFDKAQKEADQFNKSIPSTLVMQEKPKGRVPTYILERGEYDKPKKDAVIHPDVPAWLPKLTKRQADKPADRLDLARWLVRPDHPLTARVMVNRQWQRYFGHGLVKTSEDFGSQGQWPTHPELLDWLSREFVDTGWDVKRLHRLIVTSAAFQQQAKTLPVHMEKDPENQWVSRGPRHRLDAEVIRDQALFVSGLLVPKMYGKGNKPYQPQGLWKAVGYTRSNTANFKQDQGSKLFRRSLYNFWKRTSHPPNLATFDAPNREACVVRRSRTNTPLQALVLLNDIQFVEAARHLGHRLLHREGSDQQRLQAGFRLVTSRQPSNDELEVLEKYLDQQRKRYSNDEPSAQQLIAVGDTPVPGDVKPAELAAWTMVSNVLLNLDEAINK